MIERDADSSASPVRPARAEDMAPLQALVEATGLFPPEMLPEFMAGFLGDAPSADLWFCAEAEGVVGLCYAAPEPLTDGTWNMLALAVNPAHQGGGHGRRLVAHLEAVLRERGARLLIVDTSGSEAFEATRRFYLGLGYEQEAVIREYWAPGDDKVTFRKALEVTS